RRPGNGAARKHVIEIFLAAGHGIGHKLRPMRHTLFAAALTVLLPAVASAHRRVVTTGPARNEVAPPTASVSIEFDRAVDTSTVSFTTVRVFGIGSGPARGTFSFSNGNKTVTLTPNRPFHAGEIVYVNL